MNEEWSCNAVDSCFLKHSGSKNWLRKQEFNAAISKILLTVVKETEFLFKTTEGSRYHSRSLLYFFPTSNTAK